MKKTFLVFVILGVVLSELGAQGFREVSSQIGSRTFCLDVNQMGGGIVVLDYNQDNYQDILILGGKSPDVLLRNNWGGSFTDVSLDAGLSLKNVETVGGVAGDIDNDGDLDLFITTVKDQANVLLRNNGDETFTDISIEAGITEQSWSTSSTMGDYNLDGLLDIYVSNYVKFQSLPFDKDINECYPNFLYKNLGDNKFVNIAPELGVANMGCGLATTFTDFDNDSDLDLFVVNDFGLNIRPNEIYINQYPEESFVPAAKELNADVRLNGMGIAIGDYDSDEDMDYYMTNIAENVLLENSEAGDVFSNIANGTPVSNPDGTSWGAVFSDINNDTYLDLIVSNGQVIKADHQNNENRLFLGSASGTFTNVSVEYGIANPIRSRGLLVSDLNNDGLNDLLFASVSRSNEDGYRTVIYQNENENTDHWIKIKLEGERHIKDGYGSRIMVDIGERTLLREVDGGSSYLSHAAGITHFGLGTAQSVQSVEVQWPGGETSHSEDLPVDAFVTIREDGTWYLNQNQEVTAFMDEPVELGDLVTDREGTYVHFEINESGQEVRLVTRLSHVERPKEIIEKSTIALLQNPMSGQLVLQYSLVETADVAISVYDSAARLIGSSMFNQKEGSHMYYGQDDGVYLLPGIYFVRALIGDEQFLMKAVIQ